MCTAVRFVDTKGNLYFGRNLDWTSDYGERIVVTPAEASVASAFENPPIFHDSSSFKSYSAPDKHSTVEICSTSTNYSEILDHPSYTVIGVGIIQEKIPLYFDCANEMGLAVAGLNFSQSTAYMDAKEAEASKAESYYVAAYEFPFWVARNFASVKTLKEVLNRVVIVGKPLNEQLPVAKLHWIISDAKECIVLECLEDGLKIWENDVQVLTNEPEFGWHRQNLRNYISLNINDPSSNNWADANLIPFGSGGGMQGIPGDYSSPARFVKASFVANHYPIQQNENNNVVRMFRTLGSVAVPKGCVQVEGGCSNDRPEAPSFEKTLYSSCYSSKTKTYYFQRYEDLQNTAVCLDKITDEVAVPFYAS